MRESPAGQSRRPKQQGERASGAWEWLPVRVAGACPPTPTGPPPAASRLLVSSLRWRVTSSCAAARSSLASSSEREAEAEEPTRTTACRSERRGVPPRPSVTSLACAPAPPSCSLSLSSCSSFDGRTRARAPHRTHWSPQPRAANSRAAPGTSRRSASAVEPTHRCARGGCRLSLSVVRCASGWSGSGSSSLSCCCCRLVLLLAKFASFSPRSPGRKHRGTKNEERGREREDEDAHQPPRERRKEAHQVQATIDRRASLQTSRLLRQRFLSLNAMKTWI